MIFDLSSDLYIRMPLIVVQLAAHEGVRPNCAICRLLFALDSNVFVR